MPHRTSISTNVIITVCLALCLSTLSLSVNANEQKGIRINASGTASVLPEVAKLSLTFETTSVDASKAREETSKQVSSLLSALKRYTIEEDSLDSGQINVSPIYSYSNKERSLDGYQVTRHVIFTLGDLEQLEQLTKTITDSKASRLNNVHFDVRNSSHVQALALQDAIANTKSSASVIAEGYGVNLGSIDFIEHSVDQRGGTRPMPMRAMAMEAASADAEPNSYEIKKIEFQARVTATFSIDH